MTKQEFIKWATSRGWHLDKYGHLQKKTSTGVYRFKLSSISVRMEVQVIYDNGEKDWVRLKSGYLSKLSVNEDDLLIGLRR